MNNCPYIWQRAGSIKGRGGVEARRSFVSLQLIAPLKNPEARLRTDYPEMKSRRKPAAKFFKPEICEIMNNCLRQEILLSPLSRSGLNFRPCGSK